MDARAEVKNPSFDEYGRTAAKKFLKTAIVIDDHISAPAEPDEVEAVEAPAFAVVDERPSAADGEAAAPPAKPVASSEESPSNLPIKPLADAFLDQQIVCGVLKPTETDEDADVISRAVKAAEVADIVIVDWYLRGTDNKLALSILSRILQEDQKREGRLRLILVYTSAAPLHERSKELAAHLTSEGIECFLEENDDTLIRADNCRIRFVQKLVGKQGKPVESLPGLAVEEFSRLSSGLLSNFALLGIGALRDATHHLLATFDRRLDPAFVGHRAMLGDVDGARGLAMALFMLQMKSILSLPNHLGRALSDDELGAWFDDRFDYPNVDEHLKELGLKKAALRAGLLDCKFNPKAVHSALFLPDAHRLTGKAAEIEQEISRQFSRLSTFVREVGGFNPLPKGWLPTLTLGSVVRLTEGDKRRYLMCVQPLCDAARVKTERYFPFIELVEGKSDKHSENLVLLDGDSPILVTVSPDAGARHYEKFQPDPEYQLVRAKPTMQDDRIGYSFFGPGEVEYAWLGDIDAMKAQRIAVDLSGTLARVGIDEYEWLRRGGSAKS